MKRRALSFLLALLMIVSILPMAVFAEGNELTAELYGFTFTASGEIPEGASLVVTDPGAEVESRIQQDVLGIPEVGDSTMGFAVDIKIVDAQGNEWQPEDLGVTISISGFPVENAAVEVFHILDTAEAIDTAVEENVANVVSVDNADGAFDAELAASAEAESVDADEVVYTVVSGVQNMGDAISFPTDSFSAYYILTQTATRTIIFPANKSDQEHHVYVRPGETFQVVAQRRDGIIGINRTPQWAWDPSGGYPGAPDSSVMVATIVPDGAGGLTYTLSTDWSGHDVPHYEWRYRNREWVQVQDGWDYEQYHAGTCTVQVKGGAGQEYRLKCVEESKSASFADTALNATAKVVIHIVGDIPVANMPVSIGLFDSDGAFASEPFKNELKLHYDRLLKNGLQVINKDTNPNIYSSNAADLIDSSIVRSANFVQNANNAAVWGVVSGTGDETKAFLKWTESDYITIIQHFINYERSIGNTKYTGSAEDYRFVPYVIKFQATGGDGNEGANGKKPTSGSWYIDCIIIPKDKYTISYDANIEYGYEVKSGTLPNGAVVNGGDDYTVQSQNLVVKKEGETTDYTATFLYWEDQYGNRWNPNQQITNIQKDYKLKAIWSYGDQTQGALRITKQVNVAPGSLAPDANQSFTINVGFSQSVNVKYTIYDSAMLPIDGGTGSFNAASKDFSLLAGQTVVITGITKDVTYTVTELNVPENYTASYEFSNSAKKITAGITDSVNVINTYENLVYTIVHVRNGVEVNRESNLKVNGSIDITSKTSPGYLYGGTFKSDYTTVADFNDGKSTSFTPVAGETYYIWEVSPEHLQPKTMSVWTRTNGIYDVKEVYLISAIDRLYYESAGFLITSDSGDASKGLKAGNDIAYDYITVWTDNTNHTYNQLTGGGKDTANSKIVCHKLIGFTAADVQFVPYWVTLDGVTVYGTHQRNIHYNGQGTDSIHQKVTVTNNPYTPGASTKADPAFAARPMMLMSSYNMNGENDAVDVGNLPELPEEPEVPDVPDVPDVPAVVKVVDGDKAYDAEIVDGAVALTPAGVSGKLFAGWFTDAACTVPAKLAAVSDGDTVYAKYVSANFLQVKYAAVFTLFNKTVSLTAAVADKNFAETGFVIETKNGTDTVVVSSYAQKFALQNASQLFGVAKDAPLMTVDYKLSGLSKGDTLVITPYWVTADGTTVYGTARTLTYTGLTVKG